MATTRATEFWMFLSLLETLVGFKVWL